MKRWWEQYPGRLEFELEELDRAGFPYTIDEDARAHGRIVLDVVYIDNDTRVNVLVYFPDLYPFFPIGVIAPDLKLAHHQNPITKELCLLGMDTERWRPSLCAAQLLKEQIKSLLIVSAPGHQPGAINELLDAEPITAYMHDDPPCSHMGVGDWTLPADSAGGSMVIGLDSEWPVRGTVLEVLNHAGIILATAEESIRELYQASRILTGHWVRLEQRPMTDNPKHLLELVVAKNPAIRTVPWPKRGQNKSLSLVGAVFPDELVFGTVSDNWLFIARRSRIVPPRKYPSIRLNLLRAGRDSRSDFAARVPELRPLQKKIVAVFGLGSLGSISALEFARTGVRELRLVDRDRLEIDNTVRWAFGRVGAGLPKALAMKEFIRVHYPYTNAVDAFVNIGSPYPPRVEGVETYATEAQDGEILERILSGVDLVFDATAQYSVSHVLSEFCWQRRIPFVWVTTTPGAWGGMIGRVMPGMTDGCWYCVKAWQDNKIESPLSGGDLNVQPVGCVHTTFTGTAMDINPIACAAVRLAVGTLCGSSEGGYPKGHWDIGVVNLRTPSGEAIPPTWKVYVAERHPSCDHA